MMIIIPAEKTREKVDDKSGTRGNKPISSIRYLAMDPVIDLRTAQLSGMLAREVDRR